MRMGIGLGVGINRSNYAQGIFGAYATRVVADGGVVEAGACVDAVSGLLLSASLLLIPSGYKGGKLYAEIPTNGNGDLTWTRGGTANRTNASGNIELMATGVPRLDYTYGSCPAVLAEPQRTNLALRSEEFDNASWTKTALTITANSITAPDGNTTADTIVGDGSLSSKSIIQTGQTLTSGTTYTTTIYAKKNTNNFIQIVGTANVYAAGTFANYDLNSGVVGSTGGVGVVASIQNVGNGWYRCVMTAPAVLTSSTNTIIYQLIASATSVRAESNTLSTSVYIYGAQLEAGAYPSTYISTTSATATRVADSFSRNNIYTNGLITASGGTWFVELRGNVQYTRDAFSEGIRVADVATGSNNGFEIRNEGGFANLRISKRIAGASTTLFSTSTSTVKIAIKWNGTTADVFVNGTKQVSATTFTTTNMEFLVCGAADVPKFIQQMALYPEPLTDTKLIELTTL